MIKFMTILLNVAMKNHYTHPMQLQFHGKEFLMGLGELIICDEYK